MGKPAKTHRVTFLPENKTIEVEDRKTIFETLLKNNPRKVQLHFACGAEGVCQKCKVRAFQHMGPLTPTETGCLSREELSRGVRLACQARVIQDTCAEIIYKTPFSIELTDEMVMENCPGSPGAEKYYFKNTSPRGVSLEGLVHDLEVRGLLGSPCDEPNEKAVRRFAGFFDKTVTECTAVVVDHELVCLEAGNTTGKLYAVAVDLGVNTIVASLVDVCAGKQIAVVTDTNPQIELGTDYKTRIDLIEDDPLNLEILNEELRLRLDILVVELCHARNVDPSHVYEIIVSGATGMMHLLLGGDSGFVEQQTVVQRSIVVSGQLDLTFSPTARVRALPAISLCVGADMTAGILATSLNASSATTLFLDLGSTAKALLYHEDRITAASASCGPVFECVGITCGLRPGAGAVEHVTVVPEVTLSVIGASLPRGVCGSGLMELAAALKRAGIISAQGDFKAPDARTDLSDCIQSRIISKDDQAAFLLYRDDGDFQTDIYVTQSDMHLLLDAGACVAAMLQRVLEHAQADFPSVAEILVGGAFGSGMDPGILCDLDILPDTVRNKVVFVGNTSNRGAQLALLDKSFLGEAEKLVKLVECIPHVSPSSQPQHRRLSAYS